MLHSTAAEGQVVKRREEKKKKETSPPCWLRRFPRLVPGKWTRRNAITHSVSGYTMIRLTCWLWLDPASCASPDTPMPGWPPGWLPAPAWAPAWTWGPAGPAAPAPAPLVELHEASQR